MNLRGAGRSAIGRFEEVTGWRGTENSSAEEGGGGRLKCRGKGRGKTQVPGKAEEGLTVFKRRRSGRQIFCSFFEDIFPAFFGAILSSRGQLVIEIWVSR